MNVTNHLKKLVVVTMSGALLLLASSATFADSSIGIDPYGPDAGFDRPLEAAWGGWDRCTSGTLYAEWDKFVDASHGSATDYTSAPNSSSDAVASCGTSSAWLAWATNAASPAFAYSNGNYIYNLSNGGQGGKTAYRIEVAGNLSKGHTRVALQIETRSYSIAEESFSLNGIKPAVSSIKMERDTTISGRAAKVYHQLVVWNLNEAPEAIRVGFEAKEHTVLQLLAIDAGPLESVRSPAADIDETRKVLVNLPAESLEAETARLIHLQNPKYFSAAWSGSDVLFKQAVSPGGQLKRSLKGGLKALFYSATASEGKTNRIIMDVFRKDPIADIRIAECELVATHKRRWARVNLNNQIERLGTSIYALDIASTESVAMRERLTRKKGSCDLDLVKEGVQAGVPVLIEGDYTRIRRLSTGE